MMKRSLTVLLSTLFLAAVGCGQSPDPSKGNNGTQNNGAANNGTANNGGANNGGANNGTANNGGANNGTANNGTVNNGTVNNGTVNNGTTNNGTANNGTGVCTVNDVFFGQIGDEQDEHGGGVPTTDPLTTDAGLQAVLDAVPAEADGTATVELAVSGAVITATSYGMRGNRIFWVEDANGAIQTFFPQGGFEPPETLQVGMVVSFTVTEVKNYNGVPEITGLENFTIDDRGAMVPYIDASAQQLTVDDFARVVKLGGTLGTAELCDNAEACEPEGNCNFCYQLSAEGQSIEFRVRPSDLFGVESETDLEGACLTWVGPLGAFPGPLEEGAKLQLTPENFDWFWRQFDN